jgi:hypothetical protein
MDRVFQLNVFGFCAKRRCTANNEMKRPQQQQKPMLQSNVGIAKTIVEMKNDGSQRRMRPFST